MPILHASSDDVRVYEIAVMIAPDLDQKAEATLLREIDEHLGDAGAKLLFKDPWSRRGLAYPIKGFNEAKFVMYYCEVDPSKIRELQKQLTLQKGVLRHLVVMPPPRYEAISFEDAYQTWLKTRETMADVRRRKKEEKLQKQVIAGAKRQTKRAESPKKAPARPLKMDDLTHELDKIISDTDLAM